MKRVIFSAIIMVALFASGNTVAQDNTKKCPKAKTECCNQKKCPVQCSDKKACCTTDKTTCNQKCNNKKVNCTTSCPNNKKKNCSSRTCPIKK